MRHLKEIRGAGILYLISYFIGLSLVFPQSQITFRQLSVKEGLSQNSAISITQDSTGYLWIATQDGLNKYDGQQFTFFPHNFVDITKPDYSTLGKVYTDKMGTLWIIPLDKKPRKWNENAHTFEVVEGVEDASIIYQDKLFNLWIGTYDNGLILMDSITGRPSSILSTADTNGSIYNITEDEDGSIILAGNQQIVEYNKHTRATKKIQFKNRFGEEIEANFSDIVSHKLGDQWVATFGDGLYYRKKRSQSIAADYQ